MESHLVDLPSGIDHVSETLEREYRLWSFNRARLGMGQYNGSVLEKIVGVPTIPDDGTGKTRYTTDVEPSYFRDVLDVFRHYPIAKHYGLTPTDVMAMPVDQWYKIRDDVKLLPEEEDANMKVMMEIMKELVRQRNNPTGE